MATAKGLAGLQRSQMVEMVRQPLAVWLTSMMKSSFPHPKSAEACDITAEAIGLAVMDTIGSSPMGRRALEQIALDLLDKAKGQ